MMKPPSKLEKLRMPKVEAPDAELDALMADDEGSEESEPEEFADSEEAPAETNADLSALEAISDDDLLAELEKRGLVESLESPEGAPEGESEGSDLPPMPPARKPSRPMV